MTRLSWSEPTDRLFEAGLDRGVLYPKTGPAVPWNGLTSVDESGAESGSEYYIDGRPFLFLPKPKEFTATLNAYTYPDEFLEFMGITEVADGMYLDSQQSDSFGLSYRTLVGNAIEGTEAGYKIHLLYNVTVAPQDSSYETLSDSVNPTQFSWEIQTVPVFVEGYRSTAHIIINTRHMDATRLAAIEAILYGDETTVPSLPEPQDVIDTLGFGDTIIVTDNGDDTWTVEGSYLNIYLIGDGIFEIDNINAIGHGDGTYDISSTP